jgi:hypothetical protein
VGGRRESAGAEHTTFVRCIDKVQDRARNYEDCIEVEFPDC